MNRLEQYTNVLKTESLIKSLFHPFYLLSERSTVSEAGILQSWGTNVSAKKGLAVLELPPEAGIVVTLRKRADLHM